MDAWAHCTDFPVAWKATNWLLWFIWFVLFIWLILFNQTNKTNRKKPYEPLVLSLGLSRRLRLFPLEFGPTVIEPLRGCAGCVQRCRPFL